MRSWPALVALFLIPAAAWAISNPLLSVPDENAHMTKAVSIWYGQFDGRVAQPGTGARVYRLPALWALQTPCFAFHWDVGPSHCAAPIGTDHHVTDVNSNSGAYPPLYFALVGLPGRLFPRQAGLYLMRLMSALICAGLLAAAVKALQRVMNPGRAVVGVLVAVTPMTLFLAGSVNPSGFEICAGIALWAHLLAVLRHGQLGSKVTRPLLIGLFVSGTAMALTRPLSGPFAGVIVILALASVSWSTLVGLARQRSIQLTVGALTAVCVVALGLSYRTGLFNGVTSGTVIGGIPFPPGANHWAAVLGATPVYLQEMIGLFGWLDTPASNLVVYVWIGMVFALAGASLLVTRLRDNVALLATVAATVFIPVVLQAPLSGSASLIWQGRYILPIAAGIPLLAVMGIERGADRLPDGGRALSTALAVTVGLINVYALFWNLHRYTVGFTNRSLDIFRYGWQPPGGSALWVAVMVAVAAADAAVVITGGRSSPVDDLEPEREPEPDPTPTEDPVPI
jgi:hypothetical protein